MFINWSYGWKNTNRLTKSMELGETYVNVHSEEHPNGEIRGQIKGGR
jgi:hypothetical protein